MERQFDSLSQQALQDVVGSFGMGALIAAHTLVVEGDRLVLLSDKSETSRKYVVDTDAGRYFLKEVPWYCDDQQHRDFSRRVMNFCADRHLPVPRVLPSSDGGWSVQLGDSHFVLLEYKPGAPYGGGADAHGAGVALGRLHSVTQHMPLEADVPREDLQTITAAHFSLAIEVRPPSVELEARFAEARAYACDLVSGVGVSSLELPIHGDYIPWNLGFDAHRSVVAIHDFDNACVDSPLHDIGEALSSFFLVPHDGASAILKPIVAEPSVPRSYIVDFIQGYEEGVGTPFRFEHHDVALYTVGAWFESVLLSYVRGDQELAPLLVAMTTYPARLLGALTECLGSVR